MVTSSWFWCKWWFPWHLRPKVSSASEEAESSMMVPAWQISLGNQDQNHNSNGIIMGCLPKLKIPKFLIFWILYPSVSIWWNLYPVSVSESPLIPEAVWYLWGAWDHFAKGASDAPGQGELPHSPNQVLAKSFNTMNGLGIFLWMSSIWAGRNVWDFLCGGPICATTRHQWIRNHSYDSYITHTHRIPIIPLVPVIAVAMPNMGNNLNSWVWTSLALYLSS